MRSPEGVRGQDTRRLGISSLVEITKSVAASVSATCAFGMFARRAAVMDVGTVDGWSL